jgi:hypothetical protein
MGVGAARCGHEDGRHHARQHHGTRQVPGSGPQSLPKSGRWRRWRWRLGQVSQDRAQLSQSARAEGGAEALLQLAQAQPALGVMLAQLGRHLLTVRVGGPGGGGAEGPAQGGHGQIVGHQEAPTNAGEELSGGKAGRLRLPPHWSKSDSSFREFRRVERGCRLRTVAFPRIRKRAPNCRARSACGDHADLAAGPGLAPAEGKGGHRLPAAHRGPDKVPQGREETLGRRCELGFELCWRLTRRIQDGNMAQLRKPVDSSGFAGSS